MFKLSCLHHKLPIGVVAFIRSGRSLNSEVQPGDVIELTYGPEHRYHVGTARVLHVAVTQSNDIAPSLLVYNQDTRGRDLGGLRVTLGIAHHSNAEVTIAILDVFDVPNRDIPDEIAAMTEEEIADQVNGQDEDGLIGAMGDQLRAELASSEANAEAGRIYRDDVIDAMGDRLSEKDKPDPHNVLTPEELANSRDESVYNDGPTCSFAHQPDEDDSRLADEANAAATEAGRIYRDDETNGLNQPELTGHEDLTLPVDPDSHRAPRPDEDDELVEAEVEEYVEEYDEDDYDDWDDDDLEDSELEDLLGDFSDPREN